MADTSETSPTLQPLCPAHSEVEAVRTCERCGLYVCARCVRASGNCWECVRKYAALVPSSAARARWVALFLRILGVLATGHVLLYLWGILVPGARESTKTLEILGATGTFLNYVSFVVWGVTTVTYLLWLHSVVRQVNAWGRDVGATPTWAVGCWFVPLVNLVKPYRVVRSIVEELGGKPLGASLRLGTWWIAFILSRMLAMQAARMSMRMLHPSLALKVYMVQLVSMICTIVAAFLCIRIVREVQERLEVRRSGL
nr:DUF4328 domain-containing protein [Archangium violaceum]